MPLFTHHRAMRRVTAEIIGKATMEEMLPAKDTRSALPTDGTGIVAFREGAQAHIK